MEEDILYLNYIIDGVLSLMPTKVAYKKSDKNETQRIYYEVKWKDLNIISKPSEVTELAIANLQRALPSNVRIACCRSCKYGNFCPYGDYNNEIFCLKDMVYNDKNDVCEVFSTNHDSLRTRSRKLLYFCRDYKPICHSKYYTYNDWEYI